MRAQSCDNVLHCTCRHGKVEVQYWYDAGGRDTYKYSSSTGLRRDWTAALDARLYLDNYARPTVPQR